MAGEMRIATLYLPSSLRTQGLIATDASGMKIISTIVLPMGRGVWVPAFAGTTTDKG